MKKIIASFLTLCMAASIAAAGWTGGLGAAAESLVENVAQATVESAAAETAVTDGAAADTQTDPGATVTGTDTVADTETETADGTAGTGDSTENAAPEADSANPVTQAVTAAAEVPVAPTEASMDTPAEPSASDGPAWVSNGEGRQYGDLYTLLPIAKLNNLTVHLCSMSVFALYDYTCEGLQTYSFAIDTDALQSQCEGCSIIISAYDPNGSSQENVTYLWIGISAPSPADVLGEQVEIPGDVADTEEIEVQSDSYTADALCTPTFTLNASLTLDEGMTFAVTVDDGEPQAFEGNTYTPAASGTYTFVILDAQGLVIGTSRAYPVLYGTAPETDASGDATAENAEADVTEEGVLTQNDVLKSVSLAAALPQTEERDLTVDAYDYVDGVESSVTPTFILSGASADGSDYYGFSVDGGRVIRMLSDRYAVTKSGTYTFHLLDSEGNELDKSGEYHVVLNFETARENNEAWMKTGDTVIYGTLASLLRQAESGQTIYLLTDSTLTLSDASALNSVDLEPDPDLFGSDTFVENSSDSPDGNTVAGTTYVWVGVSMDLSEAESADMFVDLGTFALLGASAPAAFTLDSVSIGNRTLADSLWVNGSDPVTFTITDTDTANTYTYEVSIDGGGSFQTFSNNGTFGSLSPAMSNGTTYTVIFRITDADYPSSYITKTYTLRYDNQSPILICKAGSDKTLSFFAGDSISGFVTDGSMPNVTFSASANPVVWSASLRFLGQNVYTYSVMYAGEGAIPANSLGVRDQANNLATWGTEINISSASAVAATGVKSTGGTSGGSSRTVYHSASTHTTVTAYNGVELVVETGAMQTLTIGDQQLDLSLRLAQDVQAPEGFQPTFTADFANWNKRATSADDDTDSSADDEEPVDTLVLTAADAASVNDGDYSWTFDGSVYKKLAASGIDYLVLNVGNNAVAISTAGFAAGIRYNMYRASGLASSAFVYTVSFSTDGQTGSVTPSIDVTVDGQTYTLSGDPNSDFYYYNVCSGTLAMLDQPFGQSNVQGSGTQGRQG